MFQARGENELAVSKHPKAGCLSEISPKPLHILALQRSLLIFWEAWALMTMKHWKGYALFEHHPPARCGDTAGSLTSLPF